MAFDKGIGRGFVAVFFVVVVVLFIVIIVIMRGGSESKWQKSVQPKVRLPPLFTPT